jgi:hypothetical protein
VDRKLGRKKSSTGEEAKEKEKRLVFIAMIVA